MDIKKLKPVKAIDIKKAMKVSELTDAFENVGFGAGKINLAADILKRMQEDKDCKIFFGLAGAMVPAGMKKIVIDMIDNNYNPLRYLQNCHLYPESTN